MAGKASEPKSDPIDAAWHEIDALVDQITELSKSELPANEFYRELLDRAVSGLAAVGGAVWEERRAGQLDLQYQINLAQTGLDPNHHEWPNHRQVVQSVLQTGEARLLPPRSGSVAEGQSVNTTDLLLILCPWRVGDGSAGVVEVFQRPGASPAAQRGYLRFLTLICELLADFQRNRQLRKVGERVAQWKRFEQFAEQVHGGLDLRATAYQIANEGRRLVGCDRLSVLTYRHGKCRLLAISGVDTFNSRANVVRQLERLAAAVVAVDEPLWHDERPQEMPAEIEEQLKAYLDESHVRALAVIPLKASAQQRYPRGSPQLGAVVVEQFQRGLSEEMRAGVEAVRNHGALAMRNALELRSLPLWRTLRALERARWFVRARQLPKTLMALLAAVAALIALTVVPADFEVEARGELQPLERRDVFAPNDGVVSDLRAVDAKPVEAEEVLAVLRRPELELEFQRIWGELQTTRKQQAAVEAERLQNPRQTSEELRRYHQLTAEEEELKTRVRGLEEQYKIVRQQQSKLEVRSPIEGQVLTWDLEKLLEARPVQRGQILMTVARLEGPWILELQVPDDRIAYVMAAQEEFGPELAVSFVLATDPGVTYRGRIEKVGVRTEIAESDESIVPVSVSIDRDEIPELVPGATVVARIDCGRRSIGYVWLHDVWETLWRWVVF